MTSPAQDSDIRAGIAAQPQRTEAELEAAARRLLVESGVDPDGEDWDSTGDWYADGTEWEVLIGLSGMWGYGVFCPDHGDLTAHNGAGHGSALSAAIDLLKAHPELWPEEPAEPEPQPDPLREAAREALRLLGDVNHNPYSAGDRFCQVCEGEWPCEVEEARRRLAAALEDR